MKVKPITDSREFEALTEAWNGLLLRSSSDNVFLTHEWVDAWWRTFGEDNELLVLLCVEDDDTLVGIFPGYIKSSTIPFGTRSVRLLGSEHVTSDFLECISVAGREEEVYHAVFDYLASHSSLWDVLEITDVPEGSPFSVYLSRQSSVPAFSVHDNDKACPYISLPDSWEGFLGSLSAKTRRNVRYYRNNLGRHAAVEVELIETPEQLAEAMPDMVRLHQERKEQVGYAGRFSSESYTRFHETVCASFLPLGRLFLVFLKVDGKRVAFYYCFSFKGRVNIYQSGFDIEWSKFSVGALLMGHLIEMSIAGGNSWVDFLRGREGYKYHWTDRERKLLDFTAYNTSVRGNLAGVAQQTYSGAKSGLKRVLPEAIFAKAKKVKDSLTKK